MIKQRDQSEVGQEFDLLQNSYGNAIQATNNANALSSPIRTSLLNVLTSRGGNKVSNHSSDQFLNPNSDPNSENSSNRSQKRKTSSQFLRFSSPLTINAPHQSNVWSKLTPSSAEQLKTTARNFLIAAKNEPTVSVPKVVTSPENPFSISKKVLINLHHQMNLSLLDYLGGVNFIARVLVSDLINGLVWNEQLAKERIKYFGRNILRTTLPIATFMTTWMNKCRSYLNRQVFYCEVIRGGESQLILSSNVLVGDIVVLRKGSMVPADGLYVDGEQLEIDEGLVFCKTTSQAVNRKTHSANPFLFSLTEVVKGTGRMIVTCVGDNSSLAYYPKTLQFAVIFNNFSRAQKLIHENQLSVNIPMGREGYMLIHWVARYGNTQQMEFLFRNRVDLKQVTRLNQSSPLDLAITYNQQMVPLLLAPKNPFFIKSNPNMKDTYKRTSLFSAVRYGDANIIRLLIANNAKLTVVDCYGWTLLHFAVLYNPNNLEYLLSTQVFSRLINHRDRDGNSALVYACIKGDIESARILISYGASMNLANHVGRSVLHFLAMGDPSPKFIYHSNKRYLVFRCGKKRIPKPKIRKGAILMEERLSKTCTTFDLLPVLDLLLENGCNINIADIGGLKPIHYCILSAEIHKDSGKEMREAISQVIGYNVKLDLNHSCGSFSGNTSSSTDDHTSDDLDFKNLKDYQLLVFQKLISYGADLSIEERHLMSDAPLDT